MDCAGTGSEKPDDAGWSSSWYWPDGVERFAVIALDHDGVKLPRVKPYNQW